MPDLPPIAADDDGMRLDRYLRQQFPKLTLGAIHRALRQRQVRLNNRRVKGDSRILAGDIVYVPQFFEAPLDQTPSPVIKVNPKTEQLLRTMLVAVREDFFVLNKPRGLAVQGGSGVRWHLDKMLATLAMMHGDSPDSLRIVHRLDKETSGLMLIARGRKSAQYLARQFQQRRARKFYLALCHGVPEIAQGRIDIPLGKCPDHAYRPSGQDPKPARTDYLVWDRTDSAAASLLLSPITGRTHQLRAHLAHLQHPIIGDALYARNGLTRMPPLIAMQESKKTTTKLGMALHSVALQLSDVSQEMFIVPPAEQFLAQAKLYELDVASPRQLKRILLEVFGVNVQRK